MLSLSRRIDRELINEFERLNKDIDADKIISTLSDTEENANHGIPKSDLIQHLISPHNITP